MNHDLRGANADSFKRYSLSLLPLSSLSLVPLFKPSWTTPNPISTTQRYTPRNYVPWAVILACYIICPFILLIIRFILARENRRRDQDAISGIGVGVEGRYSGEERERKDVKREGEEAFVEEAGAEERKGGRDGSGVDKVS